MKRETRNSPLDAADDHLSAEYLEMAEAVSHITLDQLRADSRRVESIEDAVACPHERNDKTQ